MKKLAIWLVKKYAVAAIQDAAEAKKPEVAEWATKIRRWILRIGYVVGFLSDLAAALEDGSLSDAEADAAVAKAKELAGELTREG